MATVDGSSSGSSRNEAAKPGENIATNDEKSSNKEVHAVNGIKNNLQETNATSKESSEKHGPVDVPQISKNQLKRQRKWAQAMAVKKRRKAQEKSIKYARAEAQGRDIDAEKRVMENNRKVGAGWAKREEKWRRKFERECSKFQICIDCSFEDQMTGREINSLVSQLRFCYSHNKQAKHPVQAKVTSLSGVTSENLQNVSGFDQWAYRGFDHTSRDLSEELPDKSKIVYLTSDAENVVEELEDDKTYVIGGIVDRNRLKGATMNRAKKLGISTAKLPLEDHFHLVATKILTVNHVFEILVRLREHGNDWKETLLAVLPERKDAKTQQLEQGTNELVLQS